MPSYSNRFGSIDGNISTVKHKTGLQQIPLNEISSIEFERDSNRMLSYLRLFFVILIGYQFYEHPDIAIKDALIPALSALFLLLIAIAYYIGHHNIIITGTRRRQLAYIKVEMARTKEGRELVEAVRKSLKK